MCKSGFNNWHCRLASMTTDQPLLALKLQRWTDFLPEGSRDSHLHSWGWCLWIVWLRLTLKNFSAPEQVPWVSFRRHLTGHSPHPSTLWEAQFLSTIGRKFSRCSAQHALLSNMLLFRKGRWGLPRWRWISGAVNQQLQFWLVKNCKPLLYFFHVL